MLQSASSSAVQISLSIALRTWINDFRNSESQCESEIKTKTNYDAYLFIDDRGFAQGMERRRDLTT